MGHKKKLILETNVCVYCTILTETLTTLGSWRHKPVTTRDESYTLHG